MFKFVCMYFWPKDFFMKKTDIKMDGMLIGSFFTFSVLLFPCVKVSFIYICFISLSFANYLNFYLKLIRNHKRFIKRVKIT